MLAMCLGLMSAALTLQPAPNADPLDPLRKWLAGPAASRPSLDALDFAAVPLTKARAAEAAELLWQDRLRQVREARRAEWTAKSITIADKTMKFDFKVFGKKPSPRGCSLFISMHGGGNAAPEVNDQQWKNQIGLYKPEEGVYLAPRAPTNTWNLWHEAHIDGFFDRIIEDAVAFEDVDPDRVYLLGYSAGGDGVYQVTPRMADRWAAASMMAGHPNEARPDGLRNVPFAIHVGADDGGFNRNKVAAEWGGKLDKLREADPKGYEHIVELHKGRGHWMNLEDKVALPWMAGHSREAWPRRIVWFQDDVTHDRLYWLAIPPGTAKAGWTVIASVKGQEITIEKCEGPTELSILLSDRLLDLDKPVRVVRAGAGVAAAKILFDGKVMRTLRAMDQSLRERPDAAMVWMAKVDLKVGG